MTILLRSLMAFEFPEFLGNLEDFRFATDALCAEIPTPKLCGSDCEGVCVWLGMHVNGRTREYMALLVRVFVHVRDACWSIPLVPTHD